MTGPSTAVHALSDAFAARDLPAALACFVPGDDIGYAGSEQAETATGRAALTELLAGVLGRDEAYSWRATTVTVHEFGTLAYLFAEADGSVLGDDGTTESFPYRVSGLVERVGDDWLWRHCHGCEPTG
ncbi:nuclear transport factor 2 family protein [Micromonosporaceae bacterium Da 78-11]